MRILTNPTGPKVNDHVSLQWPSYKQPQGSNLRPQREQTSWSQALTTGPPPRWFSCIFLQQDKEGVWDANIIDFFYQAIVDLNYIYVYLGVFGTRCKPRFQKF